MEDPIVALINELPLDKTEDELRALLNEYHAKPLRKACTKLRLGAQKRSSTQDNKPGYINLLWSYYKAKCDGVLGALEGPRTVISDAGNHRATRHCRFRLLNVIFSDEFVVHMGEADQIPDRRALDVGAVNENCAYWTDITKAYNDDTEHYNGFSLEEGNSRFDGIDPAMASPHPSSKLRLMWKQTLARRSLSR
ncbi:hypothetical protein PR003_g15632 [Phytophthora rubi]|uniref:Uncharacterized protein n=1 Tax=Phytophthora rubi TaxID=129364 RepID=A0A6A3IM02_9STRA|nr:hypothetical protein PR001_g23967 [Phytophthora rubi]KAE8989965.1 hypothetical protein PR002_g21288 [Phytophthora rubi]KAE9329090.1 hypothetical protein PR003_g15632 [Phytophthora rubi]